MLVAVIAQSFSMTAFLRSHFTLPKTAVRSAPLNCSPSKLRSCPEKVAQPVLTLPPFWREASIIFVALSPKIAVKMSFNPMITIIAGMASFQSISKSRTFWQQSSRNTPMASPMILPVFSLSLKIPMKQGTMINSVHQPSKKISMSVIPKAFKAKITPAKINAIPHKILLIFLIFYHTP